MKQHQPPALAHALQAHFWCAEGSEKSPALLWLAQPASTVRYYKIPAP